MGFLRDLKEKVTGGGIDPEKISRRQLLEEMPEYLNLSQSISMLLMLEGEKPGVLIMSAGEKQREFIDAFCRKFDCHYRSYSGVTDPGVFIAKNQKRFKILEKSSGEFYGAKEIDVGKFLGYEKKAREYYEAHIEDDKIVAKEFRKKLQELEEQGKLKPEYEKFLELVEYVPYPDEKHIKQAVEKGEERYDALEQNRLGRKLLKKLENQVEKNGKT